MPNSLLRRIRAVLGGRSRDRADRAPAPPIRVHSAPHRHQPAVRHHPRPNRHRNAAPATSAGPPARLWQYAYLFTPDTAGLGSHPAARPYFDWKGPY